MRLRVVAALPGLLLATGCAAGGSAPEHDRFTELPQVCDLIPPETASRLIGTQYKTDTIAVETGGYCSWTHRDLESEGTRPLERKLSLHVNLHRSNRAISGADGALGELDRLSADSPNHFERVLGFGEYAVRSDTSNGVDYIIVVGNLNLKMAFTGRDIDAAGNTTPIPREQAVEQAEVFAREIAANTAKP
ncbi:hypothetical protein [Saccharopolyspora pogona]|uniref:hypothetical protein n=1 Tax=Saccharopolyspora pogona TaxID=333966 RepID=UPI001CC268AB|nr:hypothetical protein [Saccharopolyspora pogona]